MKRNLAVLMPVSATYLESPLRDNRSYRHYSIAAISRMAHRLDISDGEITLFALHPESGTDSDKFPTEWSRVFLPENDTSPTLSTLLSAMERRYGRGDDTIVFTWFDQPLLDPELARKLVDRHEQWQCDYTFADGFPRGVAPEVLRAEILPALLALSDSVALQREAIFEALQKDINAFDIETEMATVDYTPLRVSLTADTKGNFLSTQKVIAENAASGSDVLRIVVENGLVQRTRPAYIQLEVCTSFPQAVTYEPWKGLNRTKSYLSTNNAENIVASISAFSPEATVSLGYGGEPSLHPEIEHLVSLLTGAGLKTIIETSGLGWQKESVEKILDISNADISWIVLLDSDNPDLYKKIRGDGYEEVMRFIETICSRVKEKVWIQAVRLPDADPYLREMVPRWEKQCAGFIIQKYNDFCGSLPQKKVPDLSPLHRHQCRRLQREMVILTDGTVPMCFQDIHVAHGAGNILQQPIESVWNNLQERYNSQMEGTYEGICSACDEYYTVNA